MRIKEIAKAIIKGYEQDLSGMDDIMLPLLVELADESADIIELIEFAEGLAAHHDVELEDDYKQFEGFVNSIFAGARKLVGDRRHTDDNAFRLLKVDEPIRKGVTVLTLRGEQDSCDEGERFTPPLTLGKINGHNHGDVWDLVFPNGAWVCPSEAELRNPALYTLFIGA